MSYNNGKLKVLIYNINEYQCKSQNDISALTVVEISLGCLGTANPGLLDDRGTFLGSSFKPDRRNGLGTRPNDQILNV
jgi:hypothetical protein